MGYTLNNRVVFATAQLRHFCDLRTSAWVAVPSAVWASASVSAEPGLAKRRSETRGFIRENGGKPLGWGPLHKSTPLIQLIYSGYLLGTFFRDLWGIPSQGVPPFSLVIVVMP